MYEQTFGQKAVGLSLNRCAEDVLVDVVKQHYAEIIDCLDFMRIDSRSTPEQKRLASIAITEAQGGQMWAVKALTWRD